jgi:hypothetical protein
LDADQLGLIATARAAAREVAWAQRAEITGMAFGLARAAGQNLPGTNCFRSRIADMGSSSARWLARNHARPRRKAGSGLCRDVRADAMMASPAGPFHMFL